MIAEKACLLRSEMTTIPANQFISWASSFGIVPDERYEAPRCLIFQDQRGDRRFWTLPRPRKDARMFLSHLLSGLEPWEYCYIWPRGEYWRAPSSPRNRVEEERLLARYGGKIPDGLLGALRYSTSEAEHLLNLIESCSLAAISVRDDLFVLPSHGTEFLHLDHHDVVHVECSDFVQMDRFIRHMASSGYTLPDELPDVTFKQPEWMRRKSGI